MRDPDADAYIHRLQADLRMEQTARLALVEEWSRLKESIAMSNQEKIAETDNGQLDLVSDELLLTGKREDAVKIRLRSPNPGAVGVYGWDFVFADGSGAELGYIKMEIDDRYRDPAHPQYPTGMIEVLLRKFVPGGSDDAEYVKVLRLRWDVIEALVPVRGFEGASSRP